MDEKATAFLIKAYFDDLEKRISFLYELCHSDHKNEALMLCCCYIEALGNRRYNSRNSSKNYSMILQECSGNSLFAYVHPKQLKEVLANQKLFRGVYSKIEPIIDGFKKRLVTQEEVLHELSPLITKQQVCWLKEYLFKVTMAYISYDRIRSELVHDISASAISFSETTLNDQPVSELDFPLLYSALRNIFQMVRDASITTNKWWWELPA